MLLPKKKGHCFNDLTIKQKVSFQFSPYVCEGTRFTHEIAEERERFAAILKSKLQIIADLIEQKQRETGKELYARYFFLVSFNSLLNFPFSF